MINIQKHIGQVILSLESKTIIGTIKDFIIKNGKIINFIAFCDKQDTEFLLPAKNVLAFGEDCLIAKTESDIALQENIEHDCILGLPVYNQNGKILGIVKDLEIDDNLKIINLVLKNSKIPYSSVDEISKYLIMLKGPFKAKKKKTFSSKFNYLVSLQEDKIRIPNNVSVITQNTSSQSLNDSKTASNTPLIPTKTMANGALILGKTITKDIEYKGKIILKAGTQITPKVLDLAQISGTLKEIALHTI